MGIDGTQRSLAYLVRRLTCRTSVMIIDGNPYPLFVTLKFICFDKLNQEC